MNRVRSRALAAGFAVLCLAAWAMADAEAEYKMLFGQDEAKVAASRNTKDAAAFAAKLLNAAKSVGEQKDLQALLCEKAYEFGLKDPSGQQTAVEALKLLIEAAPDRKDQVQERLLKALQSRFAKSAGDDRKRVGEELVGLLVSRGDQRAESKAPAEAATLYRQALSIATGIGADQTREIMDKIKEISSQQASGRKLTDLKEKLETAPNNVSVRTQLILAYLGEFDNPAEAAKLVSGDLDEKLRTYVPLAAKPVADLDEAACLEMAYWFAEIAEKTSPAGKAVLLGKAKACCQRYLELHTTQDAARLKATMLLEKVAKGAQADGVQSTKVITLNLGKGVTMNLALIPAGKFMMGSPDDEKDRQAAEGPQHEVTISKAFYMGVFEVTQAQYQAVIASNPSNLKGASNPVEQVCWDDAVAFCKKLSAKTGKTVRLPTEAQWEYACRAGSKTRFGYGDDDEKLGDYAWYNKNSGGKTHPVGQKKPNAFGLYDMNGNVWEWCSDWYADSYANLHAGKAGANNRDPVGPDSGIARVLRGGSWDNLPWYCRAACRHRGHPSDRNGGNGFRVVVVAGRVD